MKTLVSESTEKQTKMPIKALKQCLKKEKAENENLRKASGKLKKNIGAIANIQGRIQELSQAAKWIFQKFKAISANLEQATKIMDHGSDKNSSEKVKKLMKSIAAEQKDQALLDRLEYIEKCAHGQITQFLESAIAKGDCADPKRIRGYQNKVKAKLCELIKKRHGTLSKFLAKFSDSLIQTAQLGAQFRELGLTRNEALMMLKILDPSSQGTIAPQYFKSIIEYITQKQTSEYYKNVQLLVSVWKSHNLNLIKAFSMADPHKFDVVTPQQLQKSLSKLIPDQSSTQIKKWVAIINQNHDNKVTREQFIDMIRGFYLMNEFDQFPQEYIKKYPELSNEGPDAHLRNIEAVRELNAVLKEKGMKKKQAFNYIDFNKSGDVDKKEIIQGLKSLGVRIGLIGRFLSVLSEKETQLIDMEEWLRIMSLDNEPKRGKCKQLSSTKSTFNLDKTIKSKAANNDKSTKKQASKSKDTKKSKQIKNKSIQSQRIGSTEQKYYSATKCPDKPKRSNSAKKARANQHVEMKQIDQKYSTGQNKLKKQCMKNKDHKLLIEKILDKSYMNHSEAKDQANQNKQNENEKDNVNILNKLIKTSDQNKRKQSNDKMKISTDQEQPKQSNSKQKYETGFMKPCTEKKELKQPNSNLKESNKIDKKQKDMLASLLAKPSQMQKLQNQLILSGILNTENKKRGQNLKQFNILQHLGLFCQNSPEAPAYKLIDYISDSKNQLQKQLQTLIKKSQSLPKSPYKDPSFPATLASLTPDPNSSQIDVSNIEWKHYSKIISKPQLFGQQVQPNDIKQGSLGDCYLLASFTGLAEYRNVIQRLFQYVDLDIGYFLIWMCVGGAWKLVEIDGYLPCLVGTNRLAFGSSEGGKLWVSLLEKAYAKCYGSYENIIGGVQCNAIKDLTGCPGICQNHSSLSPQKIWQQLYQANKNQYIMSAGTKPSQKSQTVQGHQQHVDEQNGIVFQHAYSILDCREIDGERILQMRNPWGDSQWKGDDWADSGSKWTEERKALLQHSVNQRDGLFWMKFDSYLKFFNFFTINYLKPQYHHHHLTKPPSKTHLLSLQASQIQSGYLIATPSDPSLSRPKQSTQRCCNYAKCFIYDKKQDKIVQEFQEKMFPTSSFVFEELGDLGRFGQQCYVVFLGRYQEEVGVNFGVYADKMATIQVQDDIEHYQQKLAHLQQSKSQCNETPTYKSWSYQLQDTFYLCYKNLKPTNLIITVQISGQNLKSVTSYLEIEPGCIKSAKTRKIDSKGQCSLQYRTKEKK